jgi:peptide/nickel transport system substrate-binding protein
MLAEGFPDISREIPCFPIGQYRQPTAYRTSITGILDGTAVFWNVRPA